MSYIDIVQVTLDTVDGPITFLNTRDIEEVLEKYIGYEFASYMTAMITEVEEDKLYAEARAYTDADAIAEENDALRSQLRDVEDSLNSIMDMITEKKRLDKADLIGRLKRTAEGITY